MNAVGGISEWILSEPPPEDNPVRTWSFDLPMVRPLSMNDRGHWAKKAREMKAVRDAAHMLAKHAGIPPLARVSVELHYAPRYVRGRDVINLAATVKPIEDGIVDAGVVPDDTAEFVEPTHAVIDPPIGGRTGRLYVVVRELPAWAGDAA